MIILVDEEKGFEKKITSHYVKISLKLGIKRNCLILIKLIYEKYTTNILNGERLNAFSQRSGKVKDVSSHHFY